MTSRIPSWLTCISALVACGDAPPAAVSGNTADGIGAGAGLAPVPAPVTKAYTQYLGQLTGRSPNPNTPEFGMTGTDLGITFQRDGTLYFLFGDTWSNLDIDDHVNTDPIAKTSANVPVGRIPKLEWFTDHRKTRAGRWLALLPGDEPMGIYNVPVEGIPLDDGGNYLFFHAGYDPNAEMGTKSILARAEGEAFDRLEVIPTEQRSTKFLSVSAFRDGGDIVIFGAGKYRKSQVHVARVPVSEFTQREKWKYYAGEDGWVEGEANADPVMDQACVGEVSVRKHTRLGYLMTYNCMPYAGGGESYPGGILLRVARAPEGPWSEPLTIHTPADGRGHYMHAVDALYVDDGLSEKNIPGMPGFDYGPYLIPAWFDEPGPGLHGIVYTLSSWNPYQVHLLRTVLAEPGFEAVPPPSPGADLPKASLQNPRFETDLAGWNAAPDTVFRRVQDERGMWFVESLSDDEERAPGLGTLWQEFSIDAATSRLRFTLYGSETNVTLYDADTKDVLRRSWSNGRPGGPKEPMQAVWQLETLRGKRVRLAIEDENHGYSGYVGAGGFELL